MTRLVIHLDGETLLPVIETAVDVAMRRLLAELATAERDKILVDKSGAAELLSVSVSTVDRLRKEGLPHITLDGRVVFRRSSLDEWAASREAGR